MPKARSAKGCQAAQGVREAYKGCRATVVVVVQLGNKSQLLPSKRHMTAIDDTISGVGLRGMRSGDA